MNAAWSRQGEHGPNCVMRIGTTGSIEAEELFENLSWRVHPRVTTDPDGHLYAVGDLKRLLLEPGCDHVGIF